MSLQPSGFIDLPEHVKPGGFDHAALHRRSAQLYIAHTVNDALDVVDCSGDCYLHSVPGLVGVAGALVSDERNLVFTSNRGENTVGIFPQADESALVRVPVGMRPNGLAFDPTRNLLLAANVGDPAVPGSFTLSLVDVTQQAMTASIPVPGRTRWIIFDPKTDAFYVNIADPPQIVIVSAAQPDRIARSFAIPAAGPHGLDLDTRRRLLYCACDAAKLVSVDIASGAVLGQLDVSGTPDVIFVNAALDHLYVAVGDPGVIDVFDTAARTRIETIPTEKGAHTIAFDPDRNKVYAFLPQTHRAAVYIDL